MKKEPEIKRNNIAADIVLTCIIFAASFWVFDAAVDTLMSKDGDFFENLLTPGFIEVWMRLIIVVMIIGISVYARRLITERKHSEKVLKESEKKYRDFVDNALVGVYKSNLKGKFFYVNEALSKMFEFESPEEMRSVQWLKLYKNKYDREVFLKHLKKTGKIDNYELKLLTKTGKNINVLLSGTLDGDVLSGMIMNITEHKKIEEELKKLAITDKLTQAHNRTSFDEIMSREMERAKRFDHPLSIIMFDIDNFKEVNDKYGHILGDEVLKTIAGLVREEIRKVDYLIRWGGEEFMIVASETHLEGAAVLTERIRKAIKNNKFDKVGRVTASFGITEFKKDDDIDSFIKRADDALYMAKSSGRDRVEISSTLSSSSRQFAIPLK